MEPNIQPDIPEEFVYKHDSNTFLGQRILKILKEKNIKKIIFGNKFNQGVWVLPENVTIVVFGKNFNQNIDYLHDSITSITFGENFNQDIIKFPQSLEHLIFQNDFSGVMPIFSNNLISLTMKGKYNNHLILQDSLKYLEICNPLYINFPSNLTHLTIPIDKGNMGLLDFLPQSLVSFESLIFCDVSIDNLKTLTNLTHLTLGNKFNQKIDNLPCSITHLTLGDNFNQKIDNLPCSITHLTFGKSFGFFL
jgi:hypothetical protein